VGTAPLPAVPAPVAPPAKTAPTAKAETPKAPSAAKKSAPVEAGQGGYWVQVGAFAEERNAEALSKQLKSENFPVTISRISRGESAPAAAKAAPSAPAAGGQNQLFITGSTPEAVNAALKGKGTAQPVKGGLVVNPPFDLETAMSLSSSLKKEGFKVVIRRAKAAPAPAVTPSSEGGGAIFHVVRVGGYPDRAKAQQVRGELEAKGHPGFLMQGSAR
jgi:DedD protein